MSGLMGVAISTTGQAHRLRFLETCVRAWRKALPLGSVIVVTVDGTQTEAEWARQMVDELHTEEACGGNVYRVGQPGSYWHRTRTIKPRDGRLGVAANKNTGIELLMKAGVQDLFLSDDDAWPLYRQSLTKHTQFASPHSMLCWGKSRLDSVGPGYAAWTWPRGVMLHTIREVVESVGGMDEGFIPGGHEHVEWSRRIHNAGWTQHPFMSPASYAEHGEAGPATRAGALWHAVDMRRAGEGSSEWAERKATNTTIKRSNDDWRRINTLLAESEGRAAFVPFAAHDNGRGSATLC